jgi:hypothetical protein
MMEKFAIDYSSLHENVNSPKRYLLADVKHRIKKVAFDVVRFMDGADIDGLWQIKQTDDGQEYIVAMYDQSAPKTEKTSCNWSVVVDKLSNASVFYKGAPVVKLALASMGISAEETEIIKEHLPQTLQTNPKLANSLINSISPTVMSELVKEYPELGKLI